MKQIPPHSPPSAKRAEVESVVPNTCREVIKPKNIHIQNSPSHVKTCTTASCFMVCGISRIAEKISARAFPTPRVSSFLLRNSSKFSGGYSFDVKTVHNTASRKAIEPSLNEY